MEVTIKTLTGKSFPLTISPTDTIDDVRRKIQDKEGNTHPTPPLTSAFVITMRGITFFC
jgi:hypothetical protein